jgi:hypothetical protein
VNSTLCDQNYAQIKTKNSNKHYHNNVNVSVLLVSIASMQNMLFTVLLHISRVTATETRAKREWQLFPKHAFDINSV